MKKNCTKCSITKDLTDFHKQTGGKFGRSPSCKVCRKTAAAEKYINNKDAEIARSRVYYMNNKESVYTRHRAYEAKKKDTDLNFKLAKNLRCRLSMAVKFFKTSSAVNDLGCSLNELRSHLETQFQPGMSWENYGDWEIDHKLPLASFDLTDPMQSKIACHYSNLQPLWAMQNRVKGAA